MAPYIFCIAISDEATNVARYDRDRRFRYSPTPRRQEVLETLVRWYGLMGENPSYARSVETLLIATGATYTQVESLIEVMRTYPANSYRLHIEDNRDHMQAQIEIRFTFTDLQRSAFPTYSEYLYSPNRRSYEDCGVLMPPMQAYPSKMEDIPVGASDLYGEVPKQAEAAFKAAAPKAEPPKRRLILKSISIETETPKS